MKAGILLLAATLLLVANAQTGVTVRKIETPNHLEDEVYRISGTKPLDGAVLLTNVWLITFDKKLPAGLPATDLLVPLFNEISADYWRITETSETAAPDISEIFEAQIINTAVGTTTSYWASLKLKLGKNLPEGPVKLRFPNVRVGVAAPPQTPWSATLHMSFIEPSTFSPPITFHQWWVPVAAGAGMAFADDAAGANGKLQPLADPDDYGILRADRINADIHGVLAPEIEFVIPEIDTDEHQNDRMSILTSGSFGPNNENNFFKVKLPLRVPLVPGQKFDCDVALDNGACDHIFDFVNPSTGGRAVKTAADGTVLTSPATGGFYKLLEVVSEEDLAVVGASRFRSMLIEVGTTVFPGDTLFVSFRICPCDANPTQVQTVKVAAGSRFGLLNSIGCGADAGGDACPGGRNFHALSLFNAKSQLTGTNRNILINLKANNRWGAYEAIPGSLIFLQRNNAAQASSGVFTRFEPFSAPMEVRNVPYTIVNRLATSSTDANSNGGFFDPLSSRGNGPIEVLLFVFRDAPTSKNVILTSLQTTDFEITIVDNGLSKSYEGKVLFSTSSTTYVPFQSGTAAYLQFDPPITALNGKVNIQFIGKVDANANLNGAQDLTGVPGGVPGVRALGGAVTAATMPSFTLRVSCRNLYGLIGCGGQCVPFNINSNCGGCGNICDNANNQFCIFDPTAADSSANRALSSNWACRNTFTVSQVPVPLSPLTRKPAMTPNTLFCPDSGSAAGYCFFWRPMKAYYDALGKAPQGTTLDTRIFTNFRWVPSQTQPANPRFTVSIHHNVDNLAEAGRLSLIPNNPILLGSTAVLASTNVNIDPKSSGSFEWFAGDRGSDDLVVVMKFDDPASAVAASGLLITDNFLKVQSRWVRPDLFPSQPFGGFKENALPAWRNADFTPLPIIGYDYTKEFNPNTNAGIQVRPSPGGVVIRFATSARVSGSLQSTNFIVFVEVRPKSDPFAPALPVNIIQAVNSRAKRDWEGIEEVTACCENGYSGKFTFARGAIARIDIAGLTSNTDYKLFLLIADTQNDPNYSPIIVREFRTGIVLGDDVALNKVNVLFKNTVTVSV
mmetsp:Transcript_10538/g.26532  ORF Transcript_10538/g.26532 Transcript_10538/m.26532 type:complete len:1072 (+) Transcript_10538:117-3332(+)|eukprot:CAMPEP_0177648846 /NCGR_PEP_ID=MMETSP0447-20121125/11048_1 /TAXON_ID=0 /ORGANISM="Stygamoeba regulata, Strain BSH-02190019" /LENGTH=1071 /DNA_ID=CAMNT_0019151519 /DNA_START=83 /DNA_END=3298 /DNA_ORIENTATION=+